ncbi:MAG: lactonase family protein, partial [Acaryochloridaceae cyanobacterium RL_2_7]|nr:lactonase family protein [Acaryochloridaceae cyanobacterium RL_2_7]
LGVNLDGSTSNFTQDLRFGGVSKNPLFGGTGDYEILNALSNGQVWATLIPDENITVNASIGGERINNQALADGQMAYIRLSRPEAPVVDQLAGLDAIAIKSTQTNTEHLYGVSTEDNALVVVNANDLSQRQLFKDGDRVQNITGNEVTLNGLGGATEVVLTPNGDFVYVSGKNDNAIAIFQRNQTTGNLTFVGSTSTKFRVGSVDIPLVVQSIVTQGDKLYANGQMVFLPMILILKPVNFPRSLRLCLLQVLAQSSSAKMVSCSIT